MESVEPIWSEHRKALALAEAADWRGTPHANRIALKGRGIDCIRYVCRILAAAGVVEQTVVPSYPTSWGFAAAENKIGEAFMRCCHGTRHPVGEWEPEFGDVCIWRSGSNSNHCGIYLGRDVWHVSTNSPAGPLVLDTARRRMQEAIRIERIGWKMPPTKLRLFDL